MSEYTRLMEEEQRQRDEAAESRKDKGPTTKISGEIADPAPQAEVLAKLVMAMMKKQGITEMNISEQNFRDCNGWMFTLEQRIKHGAAVLTIVMSRVPVAKQTGN